MSAPQHNSAKYAVIRLKQNDNILSLFQLLIRNGFGEVSFVNELNETIFSGHSKHDQVTQTQIQLTDLLEVPCQQQKQHQPQQHPSIIRPNLTSPAGSAMGVDKSSPIRPLEVDIGLLHLPQHHGVTTLPTILSNYLGLPTMPSPVAAYPPPPPPPPPPPRYFGKPSFPENLLSLATGTATTPPYSLSGTGQNLFSSAAPALATTHVSLPLYGQGVTVPSNITGGGPVGSSGNVGVIQHSQRPPKETVHVSPLAHSSSETLLSSGILPGSATTQLRQRGQRATLSDDPSMFVVCRLCKNRIMGSRISNLTNHVRRHSTLKQFQCCYCDYTHNEMAKVRLHMLHNHKDRDSQPIDNINQEMQVAWDILMKECFPEHCQQTSTTSADYGRPRRSWKHTGGASSDPSSEVTIGKESPADCGSPSESSEHKGDISSTGMTADCQDDEGCEIIESYNKYTKSGSCSSSVQRIAHCIECGDTVGCNYRLDHIQKYHIQCRPFICSVCGYDDAEFCKVNFHIIDKHRNDSGAKVLTRDMETMKDVLIPIYFPNYSLDREIDDLRHRNSTGIVSISHSPSEVENRTPPSSDDLGGKESKRNQNVTFASHRKVLRAFNCRLCLKKVYGTAGMVRHARRHALMKWHKCTRCNYCSNNYQRVSRHMVVRHRAEHEKPKLNRVVKIWRPWKSFVRQCFVNPIAFLNSATRSVNKNYHQVGVANEKLNLPSKRNGVVVSTIVDGGSKGRHPIWNQLLFAHNDSRLCKLCRCRVSSSEMKKHIDLHLPKKTYGCTKCTFSTTTVVRARAHLWKHRLVESRKRKNVKVVTNRVLSKNHFSLCFE